MSDEKPDSTQDVRVHKLLHAFDEAIPHAQNHPNREKIHSHLKALRGDKNVPLKDARALRLWETSPILKGWRNRKPTAFNASVDQILEKYPFPPESQSLLGWITGGGRGSTSGSGSKDSAKNAKRTKRTPTDYELLAIQLKEYLEQESSADMSIPHHIEKEIEEICSNFEDPNDYWYPDEWDADGGRDRAAAAIVTFLQMYEKGGDLKIRKGKNPEDKGKNPGDKGKQRTKKSKGKSKSVDTDGTPLFSAMVESGTQSQWNMIKTTCQYTGCDWADICFVGEFRLQAIPNETEPGLLTYIDNLLRGMPEALDHMESDFWGNKDLHKKYLAYRTRNPRQVPPPRDTRQSSRHVSLDPDQDRKLYTSVPKRPTKAKGFDKVWVKDWEDGNRRVRGTIVYSWPGWLDIKMPDLPGADAGGRFQAHRHKEFTPDTISKFAAWKSLEVNHWTFSKPPQSGHFGTAYVVGFNGKKKPDRRVMMAWSRTMCYNKKSSSAVNDEITLYRKDRGLNHPATYYDSDSDAEEESSSEEDESEESGSEESGSEKDDQGGEENEE